MEGERIARALARIEAAAGRIEAAARTPPGEGDYSELSARYHTLRREAGAALAELDDLIKGLGS
jgi:hypothetical protein